MIGGGIDLGRAYLTRSRLQQACDAGVLASRASLAQGWDTGAHAAADAMFDANFPAGSYGSANLSRAFTKDDEKTITGTASAEVPTSLMRLFGFKMIPVSATCGAQTQMANADIMLVLDTTTSMKQTNPGDSMTRIAALKQAVISFYNTIESNKVGSGAQVRYGFVPFGANVNVGGLLKPEWLADQWTYQSRYSFMKTTTRGGRGNPAQQIGVPDPRVSDPLPPATETVVPADSETHLCPVPASTYTVTQSIKYSTDGVTFYDNPAAVPSLAHDPDTGDDYLFAYYTRIQNGVLYNGTYNNNGTCTISRREYSNTLTYWINKWLWFPDGDPRYTSPWWHYGPIPFNVSAVKTVGAGGFLTGTGLLTVPIGNGDQTGDRTVAWRGCIEERRTVATPIDASTGIPAGALDLDIDLVPDPARPETQWGPLLPHVQFLHTTDGNKYDMNYNPDGVEAGVGPGIAAVNIGDWPKAIVPAGYKDSGYILPYPDSTLWDQNGDGLIGPDEGDSIIARCPSPARRLAEIGDVQTVSDYLDGLELVTGTYHDIGMLWGARLLSPDGLFRDDNRLSKNGGPITRHLILMTDGNTEVDIGYAGAYGLEPYDHRRQAGAPIQKSRNDAAANAALKATVEGRFQAICKAARAKFTVWVVAFGTELTDNLKDCASPNSAFQANNAAELNQRFLDIAGKIASLRITK